MDLDLQVSLSRLLAAGIDEEKLKDLDVIVLPENFDGNRQDVYDGQDAITFKQAVETAKYQMCKFL